MPLSLRRVGVTGLTRPALSPVTGPVKRMARVSLPKVSAATFVLLVLLLTMGIVLAQDAVAIVKKKWNSRRNQPPTS